jgi:hypothetical protein
MNDAVVPICRLGVHAQPSSLYCLHRSLLLWLTWSGIVRSEGRLGVNAYGAPRDHEGCYVPLIVGRYEGRFTGFSQRIIAMYARDMTVREIRGYLAEVYGTEVSPDSSAKSPPR